MEMINKRLIIEYKFSPVLKFSRLMEDFFTPTKIDAYSTFSTGNDLISFSIAGDLVNVSIKPDTLWLSMENLTEPHLKSSKKIHDSLLKVLSESFKIKRLRRIGVRSWHFLRLDHDGFENAIKWLRSKQFHDKAIPLDFPELTDFAITLEGKIRNEHLRIVYGIMTSEEIDKKIPLMVRGNHPSLAMIFDSDRFSVNRDFPLEADKVWKMYSKNQKLINNFSKSL